jgi:hypothetical protein
LPQTHDLGRAFTHPVQLDPDAPVLHRAITAEYDHGGRFSNSWVLKTPLARKGRWHGILTSWLSLQVKLPTGERMSSGVWGIVLGWWRHADDDGWSALLKAVRMGRTDGDEAVNYENPTSASIHRTLTDAAERRVDGTEHAGAGQ